MLMHIAKYGIVPNLLSPFLTGKLWKHEVVYEILRRGLPKYELVQSTMHGRVVSALFLMDNDRRTESEDDVDDCDRSPILLSDSNAGRVLADATTLTEETTVNAEGVIARNPFLPSNDLGANGMNTSGAVNTAASTSHNRQQSSRRGPTLTPRPTIGKKRAKTMAQHAAEMRRQNMAKKVAVVDNVPSLSQVLKHRQNESLERLAFAAEAKANVAKEQYMFNFYMSNPTSAASIAWFSAKAIEYASLDNNTSVEETNDGTCNEAGVVDCVIDVDDDDMYQDCDDGEDDDTNGSHHLDDCVQDIALDNVVRLSRPPSVIVVGNTAESTVTTSDDSQEESLPPTQRLVSAFNAMVEDSEMTTLT